MCAQMIITRGFGGKYEDRGRPHDYRNSELKRILSELISDRDHTSGTRAR